MGTLRKGARYVLRTVCPSEYQRSGKHYDADMSSSATPKTGAQTGLQSRAAANIGFVRTAEIDRFSVTVRFWGKQSFPL